MVKSICKALTPNVSLKHMLQGLLPCPPSPAPIPPQK